MCWIVTHKNDIGVEHGTLVRSGTQALIVDSGTDIGECAHPQPSNTGAQTMSSLHGATLPDIILSTKQGTSIQIKETWKQSLQIVQTI